MDARRFLLLLFGLFTLALLIFGLAGSAQGRPSVSLDATYAPDSGPSQPAPKGSTPTFTGTPPTDTPTLTVTLTPTFTATLTPFPTPTRHPTSPPPPSATPTPTLCPPVLTEGFELGTLGAFHNDVALCTVGGSACDWTASTQDPGTGNYSAYVAETDDTADSRLVLNNPITIPSGAIRAQLTWWHKYNFEEPAYDGGVLEISTNSGVTWADGGPYITSGGYTGTIASGYGNPLAGRSAWVSTNGESYTEVVVNLWPFAGQSILMRFRLGSDNCCLPYGTPGWLIDDVSVAMNPPGGCPTSTPTSTTPPSPTQCPGAPCTPTVTLTSTNTPTNTPTPIPTCLGEWNVVQSPNPSYSSELLGAAAVSPSDIWAVGINSGGTQSTQTLHWDGNQWSIVPNPNRPGDTFLVGVSAVSSHDVWAVGWSHSQGNGWLTLTEHWDGTQWSIVGSANHNNPENYLEGVSAVSANDVWAVGYYSGQNAYQTLIEHWDGNQWSIVPSPNVGTENNSLYAVSAIAANDAWAVGEKDYSSGTLVEHWDGSQWTVVSSPNPPGATAELVGVDAVSSNDVWAVGTSNQGPGSTDTLIEHWNGQQWRLVSSPDGGGQWNYLHGVAAIASGDVWAVGETTGQEETLIEHWDGRQWSTVPSHSPSGRGRLSAVTAVSYADVWAVGVDCWGCTPSFNLTEHYMAQCPPPPTPSHTPTRSPSYTPTRTRTPTTVGTITPAATASHTAESTPTATLCPIQFTDVPEGSTFYPFVRCMACRGIINGYSSGCESGDPCFRPNNNVTRGQLAKIVSNSAGFSEIHTTQTFVDVPTTYTFYQYIERLASRGIIGGYNDAGHCPMGTPCFLPANTATRGQLAKIDCLAYGCAGTPTAQTFEDVPPTYTFYTEIEQLYALGAINGYPCGTPPAPTCVPPHNRPFFLPGNSITRGQTAKIVTNTFFPDCDTPMK